MFIRFVSGEIDEDSRVPAGLFCAIHSVGETAFMPRHDWELLQELEDWFDEHLKSPLAATIQLRARSLVVQANRL